MKRFYTNESLESAITFVLSRNMNVTVTARHFDIPKETLRTKVIKKRNLMEFQPETFE